MTASIVSRALLMHTGVGAVIDSDPNAQVMCLPSPQKSTHNEALFSYFRGETKQDDLTVSSWAKVGYCSAAPGMMHLLIGKRMRDGIQLVSGYLKASVCMCCLCCSWQLSTWWGHPARLCLVPAAARQQTRSWTLQHVLLTSTTCKHM